MTVKSGSRLFKVSEQKLSSIQLLKQAREALVDSDAPHLDARWILAHVLERDHRDAELRSELWLGAEEARLLDRKSVV